MKRRLEQKECGEAGQGERRDNMINPERCSFDRSFCPGCKVLNSHVRHYFYSHCELTLPPAQTHWCLKKKDWFMLCRLWNAVEKSTFSLNVLQHTVYLLLEMGHLLMTVLWFPNDPSKTRPSLWHYKGISSCHRITVNRDGTGLQCGSTHFKWCLNYIQVYSATKCRALKSYFFSIQHMYKCYH